MNFMQRYFFVIPIFLLLSCTETTELLENNNPEKYTVAKDVLWASPNGFDLTMDIYTPTSGKDSYPVLLMFHGGAWLINSKEIMGQASRYLASNSEYVICNVNYRLLTDENNTVTIDKIVEDALGSVLWVQEHIGNYHGDANNIAVTGDSAGGYLAAMIVNAGHLLGPDGYSTSSLHFTPSYLPSGMAVEDVVEQGGVEVQAAILSYGVYDIYDMGLKDFESWQNPFWLVGGSLPRGVFGDNYNAMDNSRLYKGVSPSYLIPDVNNRRLPKQLLTVGSEDTLTTPESVIAYMTELKNSGQIVQFWEHEGKRHAFLDSGSSLLMGQNFEKDAPPALDVMIEFLDGIFY